jgi:DNA-binding transcriptional regulator YhcF (GntR family)
VVYLEIARRYFGTNNGEMSLSVREAAHFANIGKDTASKCFHELEAKGFIRRNVCGSFNWKLKQATT